MKIDSLSGGEITERESRVRKAFFRSLLDPFYSFCEYLELV